MRWTVLVASPMPADIADVCRAAGSSGTIVWSDHAAAATISSTESEGVLIVGSDADLATMARLVSLSGRRLAIGLLPSGPSDLLRMFGLDRSAILNRLTTGTRYPTDLGICGIGEATFPFVGHLVTRPRWVGARIARRGVRIVVGERSHYVKASQVVISNVQHLNGRTIAPRSALMDARFDIQALTGSVIARARAHRRSRLGLHLPDRGVWRRSVAQAVVSGGPRWSVLADGRPIGSGRFTAELIPGAFDLWI